MTLLREEDCAASLEICPLSSSSSILYVVIETGNELPGNDRQPAAASSEDQPKIGLDDTREKLG